MEKVKILGFGNESNFYYFIFSKKGFSSARLTEFTDLVKRVTSSKGIQGVRLHDGEQDNVDITKFIDKHESYSGENARIDVFYGKEIINITVIFSFVDKDIFLSALEEIAEFPK